MYSGISKLSVSIPVYNDADVLDELIRRLRLVCEQIQPNYEIILVNDGSRDNSWEVITKHCVADKKIIGINLARNFGQANAIAAALMQSSGDVVILMDDDLQDPPEQIPALVDALLAEGTQQAVAQWESRKDTFAKRMVSKAFFMVSNSLSDMKRKPRLGNFRAMRKSLVDSLRGYHESTSNIIAIAGYLAGDYTCVPMRRDARFAGESGYTVSKMFSLALTSILSFSLAPIRFASYAAFALCSISALMGMILIVRKCLGGVSPGWTSIIVVMLFLFGMNFAFLGILGEYIGRIFTESRQRPRYVIHETINAGDRETPGE